MLYETHIGLCIVKHRKSLLLEFDELLLKICRLYEPLSQGWDVFRVLDHNVECLLSSVRVFGVLQQVLDGKAVSNDDLFR